MCVIAGFMLCSTTGSQFEVELTAGAPPRRRRPVWLAAVAAPPAAPCQTPVPLPACPVAQSRTLVIVTGVVGGGV